MRLSRSVLVLVLLSGCSAGTPEEPPPAAKPAPVNLEKFHKPLLKIARNYDGDYQPMGKSPMLTPPPGSGACAGHSPFPRGALLVTESDDSATHGRKLFWLYAKSVSKGGTYTNEEASSVGQAIVKEAWEPGLGRGELRGPFEYARIDGEIYHAKEKAELFIMFKMDPRTPDTDEGWVYGTVTPDGKTVTAAGKVESCMKCHQTAPHDRLFGVPREKLHPQP